MAGLPLTKLFVPLLTAGEVDIRWKSLVKVSTKISLRACVFRQSANVQPAMALAGISVPSVV